MKAEPDAAVGDLLSLQARAHKDRCSSRSPGDPQGDRGRPEAPGGGRARRRARAVDGGRPLDALVAGERALAVADKLEGEASRAVADGAGGLMAPILGRVGAVVVQLPGKFTLGSAEAYDASLGPILVEAPSPRLCPASRGRPGAGLLGPARDLSPRVPGRRDARRALSPVEEPPDAGPRHRDSPARVARVWENKVTARTEVPLPDLAVHAAGRLAFAGRDPDTEHRLYENARPSTLDRVAGQPPCAARTVIRGPGGSA